MDAQGLTRRRRTAEAMGADGDGPRSPLFVRLGTIVASVTTAKDAIVARGEKAEMFLYPFVLSGYRINVRSRTGNLTFRQSLHSLFSWHNETMNVWTHLAGFLLFLFLLVQTAMLAGASRLPQPLVECAQAAEPRMCLRALALSTLSHTELARITGALSAAELPRRTLEALLEALPSIPRGTAEASAASSDGDRRRNALQHLAAVRLPFNVSLPHWFPGQRSRQPASAGERPHPSQLVRSLPGRLGLLVKRARGVASPQLEMLLNATSSGLLMTADGLEFGLNLTLAAAGEAVDVARRGEAFLQHAAVGAAADLSTHVSRLLQLSALVVSLPRLPELATLQKEAEQVLAHFSEGLHLPSLEALSPPTLERWPIYFFLATAMICLFSSGVYHLFGTANARWAGVLGTLDFIGITALIVGSFVPILFYGFYEHILMRTLYISVMCVLGSVLFSLALTPLFHDQRYREVRSALFIGLALSGVVPITHMLFHYDFDQISRSVLAGSLFTGGAYLCGTVFYLSRFPERVAPGRFDLVLSSHNIWHMMVVVAACVHYAFVIELWHERSTLSGQMASNRTDF